MRRKIILLCSAVAACSPTASGGRTKQAAAKPQTAVSTWDYQDNRSKIDDATWQTACTRSFDAADPGLEASRPYLCLQTMKGELSAKIVLPSNILDCEAESPGYVCKVRVRFDNSPARVAYAETSASDMNTMDTISFQGSDGKLFGAETGIASAARVVFALPIYNHGVEEFEFRTAGLDRKRLGMPS